MTLNLKPGDEVILPSFTFVSTATAVVQMGLTPVFVDIRPDTLNIDERLIEPAISAKTRVIMPVHYAGVACEMDAIRTIAQKHRLKIIEDAAHGVNAFYGSTPLGALGELGVFSFHQTKNLTCGEGGALIVGDESYLKTVEIHREKGTNRSDFLRKEVDKYVWIDRGSSYLMADILASFLYAQLQAMEEITQKRKKKFERYQILLSGHNNHDLRLPVVPKNCRPNFHIYYILLENKQKRDALKEYLKQQGIETASHYLPLHKSAGGKKYAKAAASHLPVTKKTADTILRLPLYPGLTLREQIFICRHIENFFKNSRDRAALALQEQ